MANIYQILHNAKNLHLFLLMGECLSGCTLLCDGVRKTQQVKLIKDKSSEDNLSEIKKNLILKPEVIWLKNSNNNECTTILGCYKICKNRFNRSQNKCLEKLKWGPHSKVGRAKLSNTEYFLV